MDCTRRLLAAQSFQSWLSHPGNNACPYLGVSLNTEVFALAISGKLWNDSAHLIHFSFTTLTGNCRHGRFVDRR
jgi:hypothetical protein